MPLPAAEILTPPAPATPRINGAKIFGVRPGSPFLFTIPATGDRPMKFSADHLPRGLKLDARTGRITGKLKKPGEFNVTLRAKNKLGVRGGKIPHRLRRHHRAHTADGLEQLELFRRRGVRGQGEARRGRDGEERPRSSTAGLTSTLTTIGRTIVTRKTRRCAGRFATPGKHRAQFAFPDMKGLAAYIHGLGLKSGTLFLARPVDLRWLRGQLAARGTGRENLCRVGF